MTKILLHISMLLISLIIVLATLSTPQTVHTKKDMRDMQFGYPVAFVSQDLSGIDPPFPWQYGFRSPLENPYKFNLLNFILSYLIVFLTAELIVVIAKKLLSLKR